MPPDPVSGLLSHIEELENSDWESYRWINSEHLFASACSSPDVIIDYWEIYSSSTIFGN